jgi:succinate dehydrogenase hydrophobic anchor subunit
MANEKSWFQKYWKDLLKVVTAVFVVFYVSVFAGVWGDRNYSSDFWPNFFKWSAIILGIVLLAGWAVLWAGQNKRR